MRSLTVFAYFLILVASLVAGGIQLAWHRNPPESLVLGYYVHMGTNSGEYLHTYWTGDFTNLYLDWRGYPPHESSNSLRYYLPWHYTEAPGRLYFAATATNVWGESGLSEEVAVDLSEIRQVRYTPDPQDILVTDDGLVLKFRAGYEYIYVFASPQITGPWTQWAQLGGSPEEPKELLIPESVLATQTSLFFKFTGTWE